MDKNSMKRMIAGELERIPRRAEGSLQNILRSAYQFAREHDLCKNPSNPRRETFFKALEAVKKDAPDFFPDCDKEFFGL